MNRAAFVLLILVLLLTLSFSGMMYFGLTGGGLANGIKSFGEAIKKIAVEISVSQTKSPDGNVSTSTSTVIINNNTRVNTPSLTLTPVPTKTVTSAPPPAPVKQCNRYIVTHLDGSTSNRCYTSSDYDQLARLGNQLWSAQSDFNFKERVCQQSKEAYQNWGGDLFKKSQEIDCAKVQPAQDKVGSLTLEMQNIENRGW